MNMDRRLWIFPALALLLAGACSKKTGGSLKLAKDTDSVAYVIGMNMGLNLQRMDSTINVEAVCEGIRDVFREKTRLSGEEARTFYLGYVNYMLPEKAREYEERFLEDIAKSNRSYARTGSGGDLYGHGGSATRSGSRPPTGTGVALRCVIRTADGRQLYSSYERGDTPARRAGLPAPGRARERETHRTGRPDRSVGFPLRRPTGAEGDKTLGIGPERTLFYEIELVGVDKYAECRGAINYAADRVHCSIILLSLCKFEPSRPGRMREAAAEEKLRCKNVIIRKR